MTIKFVPTDDDYQKAREAGAVTKFEYNLFFQGQQSMIEAARKTIDDLGDYVKKMEIAAEESNKDAYYNGYEKGKSDASNPF